MHAGCRARGQAGSVGFGSLSECGFVSPLNVGLDRSLNVGLSRSLNVALGRYLNVDLGGSLNVALGRSLNVAALLASWLAARAAEQCPISYNTIVQCVPQLRALSTAALCSVYHSTAWCPRHKPPEVGTFWLAHARLSPTRQQGISVQQPQSQP